MKIVAIAGIIILISFLILIIACIILDLYDERKEKKWESQWR